jgi:hypothetical protein
MAVLVADAVAVEGDAERRRGVEKTGGQPPEAAVAETGVVLAIDELLEIHAEAEERVLILRERAEVEDAAHQQPAEEKLGGEVVDAFHVVAVIAVLRDEPAIHQPVAHRVSQRLQDVLLGGVELVARHRVHHPVCERLDDGVGIESARRGLRDGAIAHDCDPAARRGASIL